MRAVVTVMGIDKVGIIAEVSSFLFKAGLNILDINQTIMQDIFTMIMLVDISKSNTEFKDIDRGLSELGKKIGVDIRIQHEDIFNSMHRI